MKNTNIITPTTTSDGAFILEPLAYVPTVGQKPGKFIDMRWDLEPRKDGGARKFLVLVVELDEKDALGQPVQVPQSFNMLSGGRGLSALKNQMGSFLGAPLTPLQLAKLTPATVVGKPVIVVYKTDHLGHIVFEKYLPGNVTKPA